MNIKSFDTNVLYVLNIGVVIHLLFLFFQGMFWLATNFYNI